MSRNFELLRRAEKELESLGVTAPAAAHVPLNSALPVKAGPVPEGEDARIEALIREEELKLVQRLFLSSNSNAARAVLFSGLGPTHGCGWVCARSGETLAAQVDGAVCLVDANLRAPYLHHYFGTSPGYGFAEALLESDPIHKFATQLSVSNLWLIPCGSAVADSPGLLKLERLQSRMAELRTEFDYILVTAPPLNLYAEATAIGQLTDGVVMVVEAHSTRRDVAQQAKSTLEAAHVKLLGAVLNNRTFPIPEALYRKL